MNEEKIKNAAMATFTQFMSQHRLRRTPERFAILEKVMATTDHFSIDALHATLEADGYHVSRATVYNTIELLLKCGLVRRNTFSTQSPQYEKIAGLTTHYHLVCSACGKVREIKDGEIDALLSLKRFGKFQPSFIDLNIYGLCASCVRRRKATDKAIASQITQIKKKTNRMMQRRLTGAAIRKNKTNN